MNRSKSLIALFLLILASGCESETAHGQCVGISDDKDPNLTYKVSVRNAVLSVIFVEMVFPPIVMLASETYCPVARKVK